MKFTKMQGCGNDYVYVNCFQETITAPEELAKRVSDRHFGIGADGMICICPSGVADFRMVMYNADGSQGRMCGNGIRCVGKYVYDYGLTDKTTITVETLAGIKTLYLTVQDGAVTSVRVCMGAPELRPAYIPMAAEGETFIDRPVEVAGQTWRLTAVSMGNPHAVVFTENVDSLKLEELGPQFEYLPLFPERVNTEFVEVIDDSHLKMRVWERGSGETLACGTGTCAVLTAAHLCGLARSKATVLVRGGALDIEWDQEENLIYMTGPAAVVFDGEWK